MGIFLISLGNGAKANFVLFFSETFSLTLCRPKTYVIFESLLYIYIYIYSLFNPLIKPLDDVQRC